MTTCRRFLIDGRVQGVFFRASTQREAQRLGLTGHALNLADGRVEVLACGTPDAIGELEAWLVQGPSGARVDRLEVEAVERGDVPDAFTTGHRD